MTDREDLRRAILECLSKVIDPETGGDVVHMRMLEEIFKPVWLAHKKNVRLWI